MKTLVSSALFLSFAVPVFAQDSTIRVAVGFSDAADPAVVEAAGGNVLKVHASGKVVVARMAPGRIARLRADASVTYVEEDLAISLSQDRSVTKGKPGSSTPAPSGQEIPWGVIKIGAPLAIGNPGVIVGVVDTGVDRNHPDLLANIVGSVNTISSTASAEDDNGHGTHCAGTIAGVNNDVGVVGVAPSSRIFAAKALNKRGSGWSSDLAEGIDACVIAGARVISMSWGSSSESDTIKNAIIAAQGAGNGILCIAAAGNEGSSQPGYPAATDGVLSVGATDVYDVVPSWSNRKPDLSAPGVSVKSTWKGDTYNTISGTSMACPHAAGVAALVRSKNGTLSAVEVEQKLLGGVTQPSNYSSDKHGAGIVNAANSVNATSAP